MLWPAEMWVCKPTSARCMLTPAAGQLACADLELLGGVLADFERVADPRVRRAWEGLRARREKLAVSIKVRPAPVLAQHRCCSLALGACNEMPNDTRVVPVTGPPRRGGEGDRMRRRAARGGSASRGRTLLRPACCASDAPRPLHGVPPPVFNLSLWGAQEPRAALAKYADTIYSEAVLDMKALV